MPAITLKSRSINLPALEKRLQAALGFYYGGLSAADGDIVLYTDDDIPPELLELVIDSLAQYAPATTRQQQQIARQKRLHATRRDQGDHLLDLGDYDYADGILRQLALKVHWLEQEIRDLRGLPAVDADDSP